MLEYLFKTSTSLELVKGLYDTAIVPYAKQKVSKLSWDSSRTESNPFLTKIVLKYWEEDNIELRINFYSNKSLDINIHDHRWSFFSLVLKGSMKHIQYKQQNGEFYATSSRTINSGEVYYNNHNTFHTVIASEDLITLLFRGPAVKESWEQYNLDGELIKIFSNKNKTIGCDKQVESLSQSQVIKCLKQLPKSY